MTSDAKGGLILGLGCERGTAFAEIRALAELALAAAGGAHLPLLAIVSIESRVREPALMALARHLDRPFLCFPAATLEAETPRLATPSARVFRHVGCHGVAEGAALAAGGSAARLVVPKQRSAHATAAVVRVDRAMFQVVGGRRSQFESATSDGESGWAGEASGLLAAEPSRVHKDPLCLPASPPQGGRALAAPASRIDTFGGGRLSPNVEACEQTNSHRSPVANSGLGAGNLVAGSVPLSLSPLVGEMPAGRGGLSAKAGELSESEPRNEAAPGSPCATLASSTSENLVAGSVPLSLSPLVGQMPAGRGGLWLSAEARAATEPAS